MNKPEGGPPYPVVAAHVANSSDQPVYDAELLWRRGADLYGDRNPEPLPTILPAVPSSPRGGASHRTLVLTPAVPFSCSLTPPE